MTPPPDNIQAALDDLQRVQGQLQAGVQHTIRQALQQSAASPTELTFVEANNAIAERMIKNNNSVDFTKEFFENFPNGVKIKDETATILNKLKQAGG